MVVLSEGEHVVEGSWTDTDGEEYENTLGITCSNISFIGQEKDKTIVHGGFGVSNKKNVTVKSLTLTTTSEIGCGLNVEGEEASVEMMGVSIKEGENTGLYVSSSASVKATQCEFSENDGNGVSVTGGKGIFTDCTFHHNRFYGVYADEEGTLVELRGEQTEIHHNTGSGLFTSINATLNIYIPSRSITALVHDNGQDLLTHDGGKIQSQLSLLSLELTVMQEAAPEVVDNEDEEHY